MPFWHQSAGSITTMLASGNSGSMLSPMTCRAKGSELLQLPKGSLAGGFWLALTLLSSVISAYKTV
jgi:hypothetical protein